MKCERPSFETIYMKLAMTMALRSTCKRLQVGTIITTIDFRKVLAVGYNGNASGLANQCDTQIPGQCGCLHSEENAAINCDSPRYVEKFVFVTHHPCIYCAKRLINLGNVKRVNYLHDYRNSSARELFAEVGIELNKMEFVGLLTEQ
ncbi:MAG: cytidine/deoxycytidylate deaminase family protein [Oligoflexales bacterium]